MRHSPELAAVFGDGEDEGAFDGVLLLLLLLLPVVQLLLPLLLLAVENPALPVRLAMMSGVGKLLMGGPAIFSNSIWSKELGMGASSVWRQNQRYVGCVLLQGWNGCC